MNIRTLAAATAAVVALAFAPAAPATAAPAPGDELRPYPQNCVSVTLDGLRGVYRPDSTRWEPWFDATVRGRSVPCAPGSTTGTLAVTQYHVRDGATVGQMSTPWRTAARGTTTFSRFGRILPDVAALCVSTGLTARDGAVVATHARCVRPQRRGSDHLVTRFVPVPLTDPLVNAPLTEYPAGGTAPTDPICTVDCLVSPYSETPSTGVTKDTPIDGPVEPIGPYESVCHTVTITDTFAGPPDDNVNGFDVWMTGAVESCDPPDEPTIHAVRYWPDRGIVMASWQLAQDPLAKGAAVNENTGAICLASAFRERNGALYGVHDLCWRIVKDQPDRYRLVPIPVDDPRVRKPLQSNIPEPDPELPPGPCASCL
ncbi:hypothetical protein [Paractinoplanes rishiriensis]|uniref:Secreted protein n=1 Tax=Paractinoplanes rishiriensis TaxID=1050105 RepID=A0A919JXK5_9ACTN|nr:hypothetical protein [Actinoplanes rishiriensis]GIE95504.1 hypothetical protein Ari01nite_29690 [Actinoplanes rishiriensis]